MNALHFILNASQRTFFRRKNTEKKDEILRNESGNDLLEIFKCTKHRSASFRLIDHTPPWLSHRHERMKSSVAQDGDFSHSIFSIFKHRQAVEKNKLNIKHNKMIMLFV
jgi:hypothetical protein